MSVTKITGHEIAEETITRNKVDPNTMVRRIIGSTNINIVPPTGVGDVTIYSPDVLFQESEATPTSVRVSSNLYTNANWSAILAGKDSKILLSSDPGAGIPTSNSSVIVGGSSNIISAYGASAVGINADECLIGNGSKNTIVASGEKSAPRNVILGGYNNLISTELADDNVSHSIILGGVHNIVSGGNYNVVVCGYRNSARWGGFVGSGEYNLADGRYTAVVSGMYNVSFDSGFIGGGYNNTCYGASSILCGNSCSIFPESRSCVIGAGVSNRIGAAGVSDLKDYCIIGAGSENVITGSCVSSAIVCGSANLIGGSGSMYNIIGAGSNNQVNGSRRCFIGAGNENVMEEISYSCFIGAGWKNNIRSNSISCFVGAGYSNVVQSESHEGFIGAGQNNTLNNGFCGFIGAGQKNVMGGGIYNGFIGSGYGNRVNADCASIVGGEGNVAFGLASACTGIDAVTSFQAENSHASGKFSSAGDAQSSELILRTRWTDDSHAWHHLFMDGSSLEYTITENGAYFFEVDVIAKQSGTLNAQAWKIYATVACQDGVCVMIDNATVIGVPDPLAFNWDAEVHLDGSVLSVRGRQNTGVTITMYWVARMQVTRALVLG